MKKFAWILLVIFIGISCSRKPDVLYHSDAFSLYSNKVIQGDNKAEVISSEKMISNYRSLASENYSRLLSFKFSINEKDNEKEPGKDHWIIIDKEHISPIIKFGQTDALVPDDPGTKLSANYDYTFRLDMSPVLQQFEKQGYFEAFDGSRIAKTDFKAIYLAGGSEPMTWDFSNLDENNLELLDPDGDGIYELTLILNPYDTDRSVMKEWNLRTDISDKPAYHSDQPVVDALYNLSLEEAKMNIEADSTLRTGAKWGGVWTRDVSYSTLLAFAYHEPEIAKISLLKKVNRGRIIQDTGSGGAWPVSSDRTTWALAAWEIYKYTGDHQWLEQTYEIIKNTLDDDLKTLKSEKTGMNKGESSFLDWREQTYPKWMSNADIAKSENLGTNVVHYQANIILSEMARILGKPYEKYSKRASEIKEGINNYLWMSDKGYYGQYLYGRYYMSISSRFETLGEALAILFDVTDSDRAKIIMQNAPLTSYGLSCIYPQIPGISPYHNNAIWPFVQSFWNLAAAKAGDEEVLNHGLASVYRAGALFLTNYENFVADNGDYMGTEINSDRMLWSMAGNIAMVHRVFMGMNFERDGIRFQPVIPKNYTGTKSLSNFKYRESLLNITVKGYGNQITSFLLDGEEIKEAFVSDSLNGEHQIVIQMENNDFTSGKFNLVENSFSPANPQTTLKGNSIIWDDIPGASTYNMYKNGKLFDSQESGNLSYETVDVGEYSVSAMNAEGVESFISEPLMYSHEENFSKLECENYAQKSLLPYTNFSGKGFVEISMVKNKKMVFNFNLDEGGNFFLDVRYANGTGPWNTDNNCGIRSLYVNSDYKAVLVFPQRGTDEWSDWGYSDSHEIELRKGENEIILSLKEWNTNMDGSINDALLDYIRLLRVEE